MRRSGQGHLPVSLGRASVLALLVGCGARTGLAVDISDDAAPPTDASVASRTQLTLGNVSTFYRGQDGTLFAWGGSWDGQFDLDAGAADANALGIPHTKPERVPIGWYPQIVSPMAAGACLLDDAHQVHCWGWNDLGTVNGIESSGPVLPPGVVVVSDAVDLAGQRFHCARSSAGSVQCWGYPRPCEEPSSGAASGPTPPHARPDLAALHGLSFTDNGVCGVQGSSVLCCGPNDLGQLGDGTTIKHDELTPVKLQGVPVSVMRGWGVTACALMADSSVQCWGRNNAGQVGDGTTGNIRLTPVHVGGLTDVVRLAVGGSHACALLRNHTARCWGDNQHGQLGDGTMQQRSLPVPVLAPDGAESWANIADIESGVDFACAVDLNRKVWCWGRNQYGQLGDGTTTDRPLPTPVQGLP